MGIELSIETLNLTELNERLKTVFADATQRANVVGDALEKVVPVVKARLLALTPIGPTGNLKAAVNSKVVRYFKSGVAVGVVGYNQAGTGKSRSARGGTIRRGPDRAFHQFWIEDGTKERVIDKATPPKTYQRSGYTKGSFSRSSFTMNRKGKAIRVRAHEVSSQSVSSHTVKERKPSYYASSYAELGRFQIRKFRRGEKGFITDPGYPLAFFKKSSEPIRLPAVRPGGESGRPPLKTAWAETEATAAEILQRELRIAIEAELAKFAREAA